MRFFQNNERGFVERGLENIGVLPKGNHFEQNQTALENSLFTQTRSHFYQLAVNRFRYEGLPDHVSSSYIEELLVNQGWATIFMWLGEMLVLPIVEDSVERNTLGSVVAWSAIGLNGVRFDGLNPENAVIIRNRNNNQGYNPLINLYANFVVEDMVTIRANKINQRVIHVIIVDSDKSDVLEKVNNFVLGIDRMLPVIKTKNANGIVEERVVRVEKIEDPFLADKMWESKTQIEAEFMTRIGVDSSDSNKKERMLVDEINANNDEVMLTLSEAFRNRLDAFERFKEISGKDIKVIVNSVFKQEMEEGQDVSNNDDIESIGGSSAE